MRILHSACLVGALALSSSLCAQHAPKIVTDLPAPSPPPPPSSAGTQTPGPDNAMRTPDGAVRISGGVMAGELVKKVQPSSLPCDGASGMVVMHAIIATNGRVEQLDLISGPPNANYINAVMNAVRRWEYKPYLLNGNPVRVDTTISMTIQRNGCPS